MRQEEDLTSRARDYESVQVAVGTVGWENREAHFEKGDPNAGPGDRHTLVYVTLYGGKDASVRPQRGRAHGRPILVRLGGGLFRIPRKGTRVYVLIPHGMEESPGAGVIIATCEDDQRHNMVNGDVVLSASDGAARVVAKNDGSLALFTTDDNTDNGKSVYLRVAPDGFQLVAPWGTIKFDSTGFHVLHSSGASFDLGGIYGLPAPLDQLTSYVRMSAAMINGRASAVSFGTGTPAPLASSTAIKAALSALQAEIAALGAAVAAIQADPTHVASATATAAAETTITEKAAAFASAVAALDTVTSSS